ncbi:MAG: hypothetical protein KJ634_07220 [Gammaproteobacteria bacterium]|nr:hypothetical protein [Gammaproteobacteria bacterium]MBU1415397.1 hypothetical protein [Gammaproteobacteria bacterium]
MRAWIQDALSHAKTKEQLQGVLNEVCGPYGGIVSTDVSCEAAEPRQVMCKIQLAEHRSAASLASWLGTPAPGDDIVFLTYNAPSDFKC